MKSNVNTSAIHIVGTRVILRSISLEDVTSTYLDFINNKIVSQYLDDTARKKHTLHDLRVFVKNKISKNDCVFLAIIDKEHNLHIGNIKIEPIDTINRKADLGIMIGNTKFWGKGYGTESMHMAIRFCFNTLYLNRIQLHVVVENRRAINTYKKVGFIEEGILREYTIRNGKKYDWITMSMLKKDFKPQKERLKK